jgi:hypothetical protein
VPTDLAFVSSLGINISHKEAQSMTSLLIVKSLSGLKTFLVNLTVNLSESNETYFHSIELNLLELYCEVTLKTGNCVNT